VAPATQAGLSNGVNPICSFRHPNKEVANLTSQGRRISFELFNLIPFWNSILLVYDITLIKSMKSRGKSQHERKADSLSLLTLPKGRLRVLRTQLLKSMGTRMIIRRKGNTFEAEEVFL
jgi:hypothetical protein